jgi:hypothetical protein
MEALFADTELPWGVSLALKLFFSVLELLIIGAGIYIFRKREKLFGYNRPFDALTR